jgi:hypothetical protein
VPDTKEIMVIEVLANPSHVADRLVLGLEDARSSVVNQSCLMQDEPEAGSEASLRFPHKPAVQPQRRQACHWLMVHSDRVGLLKTRTWLGVSEAH